MTDKQINIAIAEACGWEIKEKEYLAKSPDVGWWKYLDAIPNYCNDLNAMHEVEKGIQHYGYFADKLAKVMNQPRQGILLPLATARQRAEAFLKTVDKWEEDQQ